MPGHAPYRPTRSRMIRGSIASATDILDSQVDPTSIAKTQRGSKHITHVQQRAVAVLPVMCICDLQAYVQSKRGPAVCTLRGNKSTSRGKPETLSSRMLC